jgi:electron transfer flavoprotein beta subunit
MNGLKIIVLAKQVPDTRNVGKDAMKEDGTVNRAALPAIFNPEDLNALELALRLKDDYAGSTVALLTMGPARAADIIREGLFRGADNGYLLSDRAFAGSDTLATSCALSCAIRAIGAFDLIVCGRQAIDGDTAQVGPQVAEKLGIPQVTYAEEILGFETGKIRVKRRLERGVEIVEGPLPLLITVNGSAPECRPRNVKLMMKYKRAKAAGEMQNAEESCRALIEERPYLKINEMGAKDIDANADDLGLAGSPTKVKKIENVVFQAKDAKRLSDSDSDIRSLLAEIIANHTLG